MKVMWIGMVPLSSKREKILPCILDWLIYNKGLSGCNFRPLVLALRLGFDSEALPLLSYSSFGSFSVVSIVHVPQLDF